MTTSDDRLQQIEARARRGAEVSKPKRERADPVRFPIVFSVLDDNYEFTVKAAERLADELLAKVYLHKHKLKQKRTRAPEVKET